VTTAGKVYLIGSANLGTVREVFRRIEADVAAPRMRVATSFAALQHPGVVTRLHDWLLSAFAARGATFERFSVKGEDHAMPEAAARAVIERADVLFFAGGDPILAAERLVRAGADVWVKEARTRGAVCAGLSAGSIALGALWGRWSDDDPDSEPAIVPCVGAVADVVVDCHAEADDWDELRIVQRALGARARELRFAGIGHGCALVVAGDGSLEWIGEAKLLPPL